MTPTRDLARHQKRALARLEAWWKSKAQSKRHGFIAMPTGSGKTFTAVKFAVDSILDRRRGPCVVWIAHSDFLLNQAHVEFERQLRERNLHETIEIARVRGDGSGVHASVNLGMLQTLMQGDALAKLRRAGEIDIVIFDEFHHLAADKWGVVPKKFQRAEIRTLGLSATPFRKTADKTAMLREILPHRIFSIGPTELIRDRFLAEPTMLRVDVKSARPVELDAAERSHLRKFHQLKQSVLERIANQVGRDQLIVDQYLRTKERFGSTIVFCCSVDHAEHLARAFRAAGIGAESICGSGSAKDNQDKLARFRRKEFAVATSVVLLTEGVDVPVCRTVFLARPCESPVLLMQMIGRAMRGERAGGSSACTIVDFVDVLSGLDMSGLDLSASHYAFMRDHDERLRPLLRRPSAPESGGISVALLLRIREFLNAALIRRGGVTSLGQILQEEIVGWLEYFDGHTQRVLLVPEDHGERIEDALNRTLDAAKRRGPSAGAEVMADLSEDARSAYDEEALDEIGVPEEDFVAIAAAAGGDRKNLRFHNLREQSAEKNAAALQAVAAQAAELRKAVGSAEFDDPLDEFSAALRRAKIKDRA